MNIAILTYGSRGDIQPFIPLARGLFARGHSVTVAAPARFKDVLEDPSMRFVPLAGEPAELSRRMNDSGQNPIRLIRDIMDYAIAIGADVLRQTEDACQDADLIVHTFLHAVGAHTLARERNIPDVHIQLFPMFTPTGDYPNVTLPDSKVPIMNRWTHQISRWLTVWSARAGFEQVRRRAALPKRKLFSPFDENPHRPRTPILCAWSPRVLPPSSDWPSNVHVTGYLFDHLDEPYPPPVELQNFLAAGDAPVCISFGSMVHRDAEKIDHIVRESLRQTGNRGIVLSGWSQVRSGPSPDILYLDAAPHRWLLPRCKMVIHHGGAGTTASGLRAGIPNIVVPFTADQPFWGRRVHAIGVGPEPIPVRKLSVRNLASAISRSSTDIIRKNAQEIGQALQSEHGVTTSMDLLEKYSDEFQTLHR